LESFLGLVNFFGRMIQNFSSIVQPLHALRKKGVDFVWSNKHNDAFKLILAKLASPPCLQSFCLSSEATLTTDASEKAIGAVLTQNGKPVLFVSRTLTPCEQRYSNIEREALAIVWACHRLRNLLLGKHFSLVTDHQPLLKIYGKFPLPKVASSRLVRWATLLQPFDFDIEYKSGASIPYADALTRLKFESDKANEIDVVINDISSDTVTFEIVEAVKSSILSDRLAQDIIKRIKSSNWSNVRLDELPFKRANDKLTIRDGIIWMNQRCYLPPTLRKDAFQVAHEMHTGLESTFSRLKQSVWWPKMRRDLNSWIRQCPACNQIRPCVKKTPGSWQKEEPFSRVHADWFYVQGVGTMLTFVDSASGWIEVTRPMVRSTQNVIEALSILSCRFGVPHKFVTDNALEFISKDLNEFCRRNGIEKIETPPYHQSSNGSAERAVQTIKNCLKAWNLDECKMPFMSYLRRVLLHYHSSFRRRDGKTPSEHVFGRSIRVPLTRHFLFGENVRIFQGTGGKKEGTYLMERGSNTAWVLDKYIDKIRLAHFDQIAPVGTSINERTSNEEIHPDEPTTITENENERPQRLRKIPERLSYFKRGG